MTFDSEKLLDDTSWQILQALQDDARLSFAELGRRVGLSPPAVAERVHKMEEAGIITGYRAQVNAQKIGLPLMAMIGLTTTPQQYPQIIALINDLPEVLECHHVTGSCSFSIKAIASSISHLESLIEQLSRFGQTTTSIVLSSPIKERVIKQPHGFS
jgi:Lrp/AsnC family leucine-responsive transcriptional regulator